MTGWPINGWGKPFKPSHRAEITLTQPGSMTIGFLENQPQA
jgi:hypothetical protein